MRIHTFGLWHLGSVLSAHLAKVGVDVIGIDPNAAVVADLQNGKAPLFEPGLNELIQVGLKSGSLRFSTLGQDTLKTAGTVWLTFDTPVLKNDEADISFLKRQIRAAIGAMPSGSLLIISSQVPVGFCAWVEKEIRRIHPDRPIKICYSPENLRLGKSLDVLANPDRIVAGVRDAQERGLFEPILKKLSPNIIWMNLESAEMTKHAINAFLATSVVFSNELASLCENVNADARDVAAGLLSERRIGPLAYLKPGTAYAGGTLGRDIEFLNKLDRRVKTRSLLLRAVKESNVYHRDWAKRKISSELKPLKKKKVAILGLSYKSGTDTLRRSWALDLLGWLSTQGVHVHVYDPHTRKLTASFKKQVAFFPSIKEALKHADALVVGNDSPSIKNLNPYDLSQMTRCLVVDPNGILRSRLQDVNFAINYFSVGSAGNINSRIGELEL